MRHSPAPAFLSEGDAPPYAILLPADYCAQHEWGIAGLQAILGIDPDTRPNGIATRTATRAPGNHLAWVETEIPTSPVPGRRKAKTKQAGVACSVLTVSRMCALTEGGKDATIGLPRGKDGSLSAEWDGDGFRVGAFDGEARVALADIRDALEGGDAAVWLGGDGGNPFARAGLVVAVASRIPPRWSQAMLAADQDRNAMLDAAAATGIAGRLQAATPDGPPHRRIFDDPFGFYALSPRWTPEEDRGRTGHPVMFFLNPMRQDRVNYGWFTVEELDEWIAGRGPVPMTAAQAALRAGRKAG